jgi:hypothetical protein
VKFLVRFKRGQETVAEVRGVLDIPEDNLRELTQNGRPHPLGSSLVSRVPDLEADLERLTGLRVHVEQVR